MERRAGVLERIGPVDDRLRSRRPDGPVHRLEHGAAADIDPVHGQRFAHHSRGVHGAPGEHPDERDVAADAGRLRRAFERAGPADLDDMVDSRAAGQFAHRAVPFGLFAVVDRAPRAQRLGALAFRVARRHDDGARAVHDRELQGEDRNAAGAEQQDGLSRLDAAFLDQGMPRRERRARQGCGLAVIQTFGNRHRAVLRQHDLFGEHPVESAAERARHPVGGNSAGVPALEEAARNPVARLEARHPFAHCRHLAGAVRIRNPRIGQVARRRRFDRQQVAIIDRRGADAHPQLAGARLRNRAVGERQGVDAVGGNDLPRAHGRLLFNRGRFGLP